MAVVTRDQLNLIGQVADALEESARTGATIPLHRAIVRMSTYPDYQLDAEGKRIWSLGFQEYARRRCSCPPTVTRPWWKRIWSMPSPDGRPGGPWR